MLFRTQRRTLLRSLVLFAGVLALVVAPAATRADEIHLDSIGDTMVASNGADNNYGTLSIIQSGQRNSGVTRGIFRFDVASMPSYARINSITFSVYVGDDRTGDNDYVAKVYEIAQANSGWTETGATWNDAVGSTPWAGDSGLTEAGTDYIDTLLASKTFTTDFAENTQVNLTFTGDTTALTAILDRWTQQGNAGLLLIGDTGSTAIDADDDVKYTSGENASRVPQLIVDYTVPEPATGMVLLMGLGALVLLPRRRKVTSC